MKQWLAAVATVATVGLGASAGVSAQSETSVTILHGIPGVTVDLRVDDEVVIAGFDAGDTQDLTPLAGTVLENIEAVRSGSDEVVIGPIASFAVPDEGNNSVVVHLDNTGEPTITPFLNAAPPSEQGRGLLTVRHVADAAPVSVTLGDEEVITGIGNGEEGGTVLPAGEVVGAWITADGARIAAVPTLLLEANTQLIVYVGGSLEADNLEFYLQQVAAGGIESVPTPMADADQVVQQTDDEAATTDDAAAPTQEDAAQEDAAQEDAAQEDAAQEDAAPQDDGADDGTPQPDVVNTGDAIDATSGDPAILGAGIALMVLAGAALLLRRRALAAPDASSLDGAPWGPPNVESVVRRSPTPRT